MTSVARDPVRERGVHARRRYPQRRDHGRCDRTSPPVEPKTALKVIALNSVRPYKARDVDATVVGKALHVGAVVFGRVAQDARGLRLTAETRRRQRLQPPLGQTRSLPASATCRPFRPRLQRMCPPRFDCKSIPPRRSVSRSAAPTMSMPTGSISRAGTSRTNTTKTAGTARSSTSGRPSTSIRPTQLRGPGSRTPTTRCPVSSSSRP